MASHHRLTPSNFKTAVPAVEQASRVLLCLGTSPRSKLRLTDICDQVGISKSKGHSILNTLKQFELIDQDSQAKTYSLGPALIFLSQRMLANLNYPEVVAPYLEYLVLETNGTAAFGLVSGAHVFVVAKHEGNQRIGIHLPLGHRFHITLGAHGKAIAAFMDDDEREKLLQKKNLHFYGEAALCNLKRLKGELAACRAQGFAQDAGEITPGVNVVSAPVFGIGDRIVGCIVLIGTWPVSNIREYGLKTAQGAKQVSRKLGANVQAIFPA